jgi:hypothetical protein
MNRSPSFRVPLPDGPGAVQYAEQLTAMLNNGRLWRQGHPVANVEINFTWPANTVIIGGIDDAIKVGYVKTNDDGLALLKALWPWEGRTCPTVMMVRAVCEALFK